MNDTRITKKDFFLLSRCYELPKLIEFLHALNKFSREEVDETKGKKFWVRPIGNKFIFKDKWTVKKYPTIDATACCIVQKKQQREWRKTTEWEVCMRPPL